MNRRFRKAINEESVCGACEWTNPVVPPYSTETLSNRLVDGLPSWLQAQGLPRIGDGGVRAILRAYGRSGRRFGAGEPEKVYRFIEPISS